MKKIVRLVVFAAMLLTACVTYAEGPDTNCPLNICLPD